MLADELQKLKKFYETGTPKQQASVRGIIMERYYDENTGVFTDAGYQDDEEFSGNVNDGQDIPDNVWELIEKDDRTETIEDLAANDVLKTYEQETKSHKKEDIKLNRAIERNHKLPPGSLNLSLEDELTRVVRETRIGEDEFKDLPDELREKIIAALNAAEEDENARAEYGLPQRKREFDPQDIVDDLIENIPILDQKKFQEKVRELIQIRESEMLGMGRGERGRG